MTYIVLVWTPSGSCPLCLTPPCYQLQKPPETAALFLASLSASCNRRRTVPNPHSRVLGSLNHPTARKP